MYRLRRPRSQGCSSEIRALARRPFVRPAFMHEQSRRPSFRDRGIAESSPRAQNRPRKPPQLAANGLASIRRVCGLRVKRRASTRSMLFRQSQHPKDYGQNNRGRNDCGADYPGTPGSHFYGGPQPAKNHTCSRSLRSLRSFCLQSEHVVSSMGKWVPCPA
jgi:hypothetical protein